MGEGVDRDAILTAEEVDRMRGIVGGPAWRTQVIALAASHEALRAENLRLKNDLRALEREMER